ncbi:FKBP-type peptidyl-prolyl cis-trans isomerase [Spirillospora sp. CA-253888]
MAEDDKPRGEPAVKAKLPSAQNIRSPEFKPHGLGGDSRTRGPKPSGLTAAQAKKRRMVIVAGVLVAAVAIGAVATWYLTRPGPEITVSGAFGKEAKVTIPKDLVPEGDKLTVTTPVKGQGKKVADGDMVYARHVFYKWAKGTGDDAKKSTSKELSSTFKEAGGQIQPLMIGKSGVKGVDKGLVGQTVGSRVILQVPPSQGFGEQGQQLELGKNDWLVFALDILESVSPKAGAQGTEHKVDDKKLPEVEAGKPGEAPKVTIPKDTDAPKELKTEVLVEGTGPAVAKGETAIVQYQGQLWKNGKVFDSSWQKGGTPVGFPVGTGGTVPGFDKGLTGQKVGSRVLLVLPPKEGYGTKGAPQAGIKGDDTLVFVVEILGKLPK